MGGTANILILTTSGANITGTANITSNIVGGANLAITANGTFGNINSVTGILTVTGNVTASANVAVTSNVTAGNINSVSGILSVTGNANVGNIGSSGVVRDSKGDVRDIPQNAKTAAYTLLVSDAGQHISSNANVTIPNSVFSTGQAITVYNNSASNITVVQGASVTMYQVGTANTGNRTLAQRGLVTILCVASNTFVISGGGLS